jgi:hypothetical protein
MSPIVIAFVVLAGPSGAFDLLANPRTTCRSRWSACG